MQLQAYDFLPWQKSLASQWLLSKDRFAHAWLVHGMPGIGQEQFVIAASASLLCESPVDGLACGKCQACGWISAGNHPDLRRIRSEANMQREGEELTGSKKTASREIKIEQIRSLQPWFNTATHRGGLRVAVLYLAEDLNQAAANALLKILEEPPEHTVFLLAASAPDSLLPTIVSRCRRIVLARPEHDTALAWLQQQSIDNPDKRLTAAGGAPLLAIYNADKDPVPVWLAGFLNMVISRNPDCSYIADQFLQQDAAVWIDAIQRLWFDLVSSSFNLEPYYFPAEKEKIAQVAGAADIGRLIGFEKWLREKKSLAGHPLNAKLLADTIANHLIMAIKPVS